MAARLARIGVRPDLIVSSPARRAKKTAIQMAEATGYETADIRYYNDLYLGFLKYHLQLIDELLVITSYSIHYTKLYELQKAC